MARAITPVPGAPVMALSERGQRLSDYTEDEVTHILSLLAANAGMPEPTIAQLRDEGFEMDRDKLYRWRTETFPRRYWEIRRSQAQDLGEEIAGRAFERAIQADDAEQVYLEAAVRKVEKVSPSQLAASVRALSQAKAENIEKARLLRDQPSEIKEVRTVDEIVNYLTKADVVVVQGTAEEVDP